MRSHTALLIVFSLPVLLQGCEVYDYFYYRELNTVKAKLQALPGIEHVEAGGNEDLTLEDLWARIRLTSGGELLLFGLTRDSFQGSARVNVGRAGGLVPKLSGYGYVGGVKTASGEPVQSQFFGFSAAFDAEGAFSSQLARPIKNAADAIVRYQEIVAALQTWPRCPNFNDLLAADGTQYRFCTQVGEPDGWWPESPVGSSRPTSSTCSRHTSKKGKTTVDAMSRR